METPSRHSFTLDGSTRVFPIPSPIKGDNYCRLEVDGTIINDRTKYDIVNNSIVFIDAADVPAGSQLDVLVVQSEEAIGQLTITTNIDIVASNIADVNTVAGDITNVNTVAGNTTNVNTVATNIANVNTTATNITSVNTVATNVADVVSVADNMAEVLLADTNAATATAQATIATTQAGIATTQATTATTQAGIATTQAGLADTARIAAEAAQAAAEAAVDLIESQYLGAQASDPSVDLNGNALTAGDWYFNTTLLKARVYNGAAWQDAAYTLDPTFDTITLSGGTGTQGQMSWNAVEETVDLIQNGATLQLGQEIQWHCRNNTGVTITNGTAVMATGTLGASGKLTIAPYDASNTAYTELLLGIATEDIANGDDGKITHFGKVRDIDTSAWTNGDVLYPNPAVLGGLTNVAPTTGIQQPIAFVIYAAVNGILAIRVDTYDHNAHLDVADLGVTVQEYDADTAKTDVAQTFTASQRGTLTTDNDLSFDMNITNNFKCTPTATGTLTFTNITSGQSGNIWLDNSGGYAISAAASIYISASDLTTISTAGVYRLTYFTEGTNVAVNVSAALTSGGI